MTSLPASDSPFEGAHRMRNYLVVWLVSAAFAVALYWPALAGPPVAEDLAFIFSNPWMFDLSLAGIFELFNPAGEARYYHQQYAPLHQFLTGIETRLFVDDMRGYHVVNVLLHATNVTLLVACIVWPECASRSCGSRRPASRR